MTITVRRGSTWWSCSISPSPPVVGICEATKARHRLGLRLAKAVASSAVLASTAAVKISNVEAMGAGDIGSSITGLPGFPVEDVLLENIRIVSSGGGTEEQARCEVPEIPDAYPEYNM